MPQKQAAVEDDSKVSSDMDLAVWRDTAKRN